MYFGMTLSVIFWNFLRTPCHKYATRGGRGAVMVRLLLLWFYVLGVHGNWFKEHARSMFEQHGSDSILYYEHPTTVREFALLPALINEPQVIIGALQAKGTLFEDVPTRMNRTSYRRFRFTVQTKGMCFCCYHSGVWNRKWKGYTNKTNVFFDRLGNYSSCTDNFWLWGEYNNTYAATISLSDTDFADLYPEYPMFTADYSGEGSICSGLMARDPNLWFFYNGWATNYHPGNYQCVGIGYFTLPVQVKSISRTRRATGGNGELVGKMGADCNDMVIVGRQMSGSEVSRVLGGAIAGTLTLGAYPGIIAQENRKSILGLTCRLEKSINATSIMIRAMQSEIEELNQQVAQHRFVLDYMLARQGGFCTIVQGKLKQACQVKFHDLNKTIEDEISKLQKMVSNNWTGSPGSDGLWSWLTSWLPDFTWLKTLILVSVAGAFVLLLIACVLPCLFACIRKMMSETLNFQMYQALS